MLHNQISSPSFRRVAATSLLLILALAVPAVAAPPPAPAPIHAVRYTCTIIDDSVGHAFIEATAINNNGQVAGTAVGHLGVKYKVAPGATEYWHGFVWYKGHFTDLGVLPGAAVSDANSINDRSQVVGTSGPLGRSGNAYVWENGRMQPLGTPYGLGSAAHWINNAGQIAGNVETVARRTEAVVWKLSSGRAPSATLPSVVPNQEDAVVVNDAGDVLCSARYRPYLVKDGATTNIGTLGGPAATGTALNGLDQVVGVSTTATGVTHMFEWSHGKLADLNYRPPGVLHVPIIYSVNGINNHSQVVGIVMVKYQNHAMLFENGNIDDLNEYIKPYKNLTLEIARAINDRGQIVGTGHVGNRPVSFILTPIAALQPIVNPPYPQPAALKPGTSIASATPGAFNRRWQ